jgi:hypothetical protein
MSIKVIKNNKDADITSIFDLEIELIERRGMLYDFDSRIPIPQRGMTSLEATEFIKKIFPEEEIWVLWNTDVFSNSYSRALGKLGADQTKQSGEFGNWKWERIKISYPEVFYWYGEKPKAKFMSWLGVIKVTNEKENTEFLLFSYLSSHGEGGRLYLASTNNINLLYTFAQDARKYLAEELKGIGITVYGGRSFTLDPNKKETIFLDEKMKEDIDTQIISFFENKDLYKKLGAPYKRGFLFVGPAGNGKTLMLRNIIKTHAVKYSISVRLLEANIGIDEEDLDVIFNNEENSPILILLEDMDSLTKESKLTRAGLLSKLDGLNSNKGILVIGTTNNPQDIDPALIHRPSRFDRVWHFNPPISKLRYDYLNWAITEDLKDRDQILEEITNKTKGWTFAYLNELRITASILAINRKKENIEKEDLLKALDQLVYQFKLGEKNHVFTDEEKMVGFNNKS